MRRCFQDSYRHVPRLTTTYRILILLDVTVLGKADGKIGDPQAIGTGATNNAAKPAPAQEQKPAPARNGMIAKAGGSTAPNRPSAPGAGANRGAAAKSNTGFPVYPIEGLSPYQNKCVNLLASTRKPFNAHCQPLLCVWQFTGGRSKLES